MIDERWRYNLRSPHWRLYRNRDAGAWIEHPGGRFRLDPGRLVWLPPWGDFRSGCSGRVRHLFLHAEILGIEGGWDDGLLSLPQPVADDAALAALADRCEGADAALWADALLHTACAAWIAGLPPAQRAALDDRLDGPDPIAPALRLVEDHLDGPLPVGALARACGLSEDSLGRVMRRRLGMTPAAWIRRRRTARAAELLSATGEPVEAIAARCGFANRHHFTRVFTAVMGCPPAAHRRTARAWLPAART